ncbi:MAG: transposase [Endozoicomonadaceae bacterium]|nr:transposase [Endozoicomonadaceae bacterium]
MLYRIHVGSPWRDIPAEFGEWNSISKKFNAWSIQLKWLKIFQSIMQDPDIEWVFIDGSYVRAHQHSTGVVGGPDAIGQSH